MPRSGYRYKQEKMGWIYFIECESGGGIKIGWAYSPPARLADLQTATPHQLRLLAAMRGCRKEELAVQAKFADLHIRGEWFKPSLVLRSFIEGVRQKFGHDPWDDWKREPAELERIREKLERLYSELASGVSTGVSKWSVRGMEAQWAALIDERGGMEAILALGRKTRKEQERRRKMKSPPTLG